jgi:archaellum biogenesis protein FlaJ (TadC family)
MVYVGYFVSATCLIMLYVGFKTVVPKDILVHIDKEIPPKSYTQFKLTLPIALACIVPSILVGMVFSPPYAFLACGLAFFIPGFFAYRLETLVLKIDENYPTLIKGLGESMASSSSLENALFYVLYLELGRLKALVKRAFARVKFGSSNAKALNLLSSETASHNVYTSNRIFLDAFSRGADLLEVGKVLGNHCVRNQQTRKKREAIAKSLVTVTFLLQPITVTLLTVLTHLTTYFSKMLTSVPYFTFGQIPLDVIHIGNIFMIVLVTLLNSFTLKDARGGFWGTSLLYVSILLLLSGVAWLGAEMLMAVAFGGAFGGIEGILGTV